MIIKFIGFLFFLLITIFGFWCIFFLSIFSIYWFISVIIISLLSKIFAPRFFKYKNGKGKKIQNT